MSSTNPGDRNNETPDVVEKQKCRHKQTFLQIRNPNAFFSKQTSVYTQLSFMEKQDYLEGKKILDRQQKCINFYCNILNSLLHLLSANFYHLMESAFNRVVYSSYSYWPLCFIELHIYWTLEGDNTELSPAESHRLFTLT